MRLIVIKEIERQNKPAIPVGTIFSRTGEEAQRLINEGFATPEGEQVKTITNKPKKTTKKDKAIKTKKI